MITVSAKADDGTDLSTSETFEAVEASGLPVLLAAIDRVATDLTNLLHAPEVEPFVGPAIFSRFAVAYRAGLFWPFRFKFSAVFGGLDMRPRLWRPAANREPLAILCQWVPPTTGPLRVGATWRGVWRRARAAGRGRLRHSTSIRLESIPLIH